MLCSSSSMLLTSHLPFCQIYFSSRLPSPGARTPVHTCNTSTSEAQPGDTVSFFCGDGRPSPVASESSSRNHSLQKASATDLAQGQKHFFASLNKLFKFFNFWFCSINPFSSCIQELNTCKKRHELKGCRV